MNATNTDQNPGTLPSEIPDELNKWSWGGFWLNWIWGVFNGTWIGLLCFTGVGAFIMPFVLGYKGREWAWKNRKWDSVDHFVQTQKKWDLWGNIFGILSVLISIGLVVSSIFLGSMALQEAAVSSPDALNASSESVIASSPPPVASDSSVSSPSAVAPPVAAPQAVAPVAQVVQPTVDLSGVWSSSTTDDITVVQNGNKVVGKYSYKGNNGAKIQGSFDGEIDGSNVLKGVWTEAPSKKPQEKTSGPMEMKLSDDGSVLDGWYGNMDGTERTPWSLGRK